MTPIQMKRNHPGVQLSVLVPEADQFAVLDALFAKTTTLGARTCPMQRWKLKRKEIVAETPYGPVRVKVARRGDTVLDIAPEHRECQRIAEERGIPLKGIHQAALAAARTQTKANPRLTSRDKEQL
ncbi:MAG: DUF111 family protein [Anaerolineae bacterium]|jgi:hypothetical protein